MFNTNTTYPTILVPMDSDDLVRDIYTQLLELYAYDLEIEVLAEKLKKISPPQPLPEPYPWERNRTWPSPNTNPLDPWNTPFYYGSPVPPYKVTCSTIQQNDLKYSEDWDAWYDPNRNEWVEDKCSDPTCDYCEGRPERPLA